MSLVAMNPRLDNPRTGLRLESNHPSPTDTEDYRCSSCPLIKTNRDKVRNLVICVGGAENKFSMKNTNVLELFSRLIKDEDQSVFYHSGIGNYAHPSFTSPHYIKQVIDHKIDLANAWHFEGTVHAAYKWLSEKYEPGDRIFLFGFSRGAYQVRVIAGMIERVGLLHKGNQDQIPFAYELYAAMTERGARPSPDMELTGEGIQRTESQPEVLRSQPSQNHQAGMVNQSAGSQSLTDGSWLRRISHCFRSLRQEKKTTFQTALDLCRRFKRTLSREDVKVHFVGAWDTVSAIGAARSVAPPETTSGMQHVCFFRHALALDERRVKFLPEYANGGCGPSAQPAKGEVKVKEVWFAGSHSDIGGGNMDNNNLHDFGPALRWMTYEAMNCGLRMKPYEGKWIDAQRTNSMTAFWKGLEILPIRSLAYTDENRTTRFPHLAKPRIIQPHQQIHASVISLLNNNGAYDPKTCINLPGHSKPTTLADLFHQGDTAYLRSITEPDPFTSASSRLCELKDACDNLDKPNVDGESEDIYSKWHGFDKALKGLTYPETRGDLQASVSVTEVAGSAQTLLKALEREYERHRLDFLTSPTKQMQTLTELLSAFNPGSKWKEHFKSGSDLPPTPAQMERWTSLCRMWNQEMVDKVLETFAIRLLQTHQIHGDVQFICHSSADGSILIATDKECVTWDGSVHKPDHLHSLPPRTEMAVFSSDGLWVAHISHTHDKLVVFNAASGDAKAHDDLNVRIVAFSHRHTLLATASATGGLTLWSIEHNELEPRPLHGHTDQVHGLAFSSDDSHLASGSYDHTVRIWDVDSGMELAVFEHQHFILSVAWCSSGDGIIFGDRVGGVIIWNTMDNTSRIFAIHHTHASSLAFSPDGHMLAIGGDDKIQVWDFVKPALLWNFRTVNEIYTLSFLADKRLISGEEGCFELWDVVAHAQM